MPVHPEEVISHDLRRAVVNHTEDRNADLLIGEWEPERYHAELLGSDVDWFMEHAPCDTVFLRDREVEDIEEVSVITRGGTYRTLKVLLADAIAQQHGARVRCITTIDEDASEDVATTTAEYLRGLQAFCESPTTSDIVRTSDTTQGIVAAAGDTDIAIIGTVAHSRLHEFVFGDPATEISDRLDATVLLVHPKELKSRSFLRELVAKVAF